MMKKTLLLTLILCCLILPIGASAYTAYVSVDDTLDFSRIDKIQFDTSVGVLLGDITLYAVAAPGLPGSYDGAFSQGAQPFINTWNAGILTTPAIGVDALDSEGTGNTLTQGVLLSIAKPDSFTLSNFILREFNPLAPGYTDYPLPFTVTENMVTGGVEYIYTAVPIPGSLLLLGSGVMGLVGLTRGRS